MIYTADKTVQAIDEAIQKDQGSAYRFWLGKVIPHMEDAYRSGEDDGFRSHMGGSLIGRECGRDIWYGFRWAVQSNFPGRILRLFNRGHLEEARFIAMLLSGGMQVFQQDADGHQYKISDCGGHFGGSTDGIVLGCPDVPEGEQALGEFKTHNDKSFKKLQKEGMRKSKLEHYVQMQVYMNKMGLSYGLYLAVNKNDDSLYAEVIVYDPEVAEQFLDRGRTLIFFEGIPERISESPGWYQCGWCDHKQVCHHKAAPEVNCRTCRSSYPHEDGSWRCTHPSKGPNELTLTKEMQLAGCDQYGVSDKF